MGMKTKVRSTHAPKLANRIKKHSKTRVIGGLERTALTNALSVVSGAKAKRGLRVDLDTVVISTKGGIKGNGKKSLLRHYIVRGAKPVGSVVASGVTAVGREQLNITNMATDESKPIAERLRLLGARPGSRLDGEQVVKVISSIRADAEQITGSGATASKLLANTNFDGTGMTAEELVREGRAGRVLSRLDDLRYGARG